MQEVIKNIVLHSDFWLKHHQNLGFQLLLDQFCEGQAYNGFEGILQNQKNNKTKKTSKKQTQQKTINTKKNNV